MLGWKQVIILFVLFFHGVKIIHGEHIDYKTQWAMKFDSFGEQEVLALNNTFLRIVNYEPVYNSGIYFIYINSLDLLPRSTCKIPVTTSSDRAHVNVVRLGNGNIVAWLSAAIFEIVIINTTLCTSKTIFYDKGMHAIFPYYDTFDIVDDGERCPGDVGCVYRYNSTSGSLTQKFHNVQLYSYFVTRRFGMFKEYTPSENYFIIRRLKDALTAIDVLNSTFNTVNTYAFNHSIDAYSTAHGYFGLCYTKYDHSSSSAKNILQCTTFDHKFNTRVNATKIKYRNSIRSMKMHNLRDGGAIVVYCIPVYVSSCNVYYRHIDSKGKTGDEDILVEESRSENVDIDIFEVDAVAKTYCIVLSKINFVYGKCINVS